jgi:hypothetical protein
MWQKLANNFIMELRKAILYSLWTMLTLELPLLQGARITLSEFMMKKPRLLRPNFEGSNGKLMAIVIAFRQSSLCLKMPISLPVEGGTRIWDIREGNSIATVFGPKISGDSIDLRDNLLLTGANRGHDQL